MYHWFGKNSIILHHTKLLLVPVVPNWTLTVGHNNPSLFSISLIFFCCKKDWYVKRFSCCYNLGLIHDGELYWQIPAGEEALLDLRWGWHCAPEILGYRRISVLEAQSFLQHQWEEEESCWKCWVKPYPGSLPMKAEKGCCVPGTLLCQHRHFCRKEGLSQS